jgi:hypothetical protein
MFDVSKIKQTGTSLYILYSGKLTKWQTDTVSCRQQRSFFVLTHFVATQSDTQEEGNSSTEHNVLTF